LVDLRHHDLIWVEDEGGPHRGWGLDEVRRVGGVPRLSVSHVDAAIAAAVDGLGVLRTLSYQVAGEIEAGRLVPLLRDDEAPALPVSLLFEGGRKHHPNVRAFIEATKRFMKPF
jgi:DNA-binding transcriptional LysR family regulator